MGTAERREREKQKRVNAILDAAEEVFADKGIRNATIDDVAARAELSKGTIYLYFKSKEVIFLGIDLRANTLLRQKFIEAAATRKSGLAKVLAIGKAYFKFCFDYPNYFWAMSMVEHMEIEKMCAVQDEPLARQAHEAGQGTLQILADCVQLGIEDGTITPKADPWLTTIMLWAQSNGIIQMIKNQLGHFAAHGLDINPLFKHYLKLKVIGLSTRTRS